MIDSCFTTPLLTVCVCRQQVQHRGAVDGGEHLAALLLQPRLELRARHRAAADPVGGAGCEGRC